MVIWNVREMAKKRGIKTAAELQKRADINKNTATVLLNGSSLRVDRETLTKLCDALDCTPGELLVYMDEEKNQTPDLAAALA